MERESERMNNRTGFYRNTQKSNIRMIKIVTNSHEIS